MKLKQFHSQSELEDKSAIQSMAINVEQKLTQVYLADIATERYKSVLRRNSSEGVWHLFDIATGLWERIGEEQVIALLMQTLKDMRAIEADKIKISGTNRSSVIKEIERAESKNFLSGTESLMRSMHELVIPATVFDADLDLVGLQNGQCLDLFDCSIRPIDQSDYLTRRISTSFNKDAKCSKWEKSVLEWTRNDKELAKFLQVWCGYCLSGRTDFQGFLFLYGSGQNGKSVFVNVISKLLGAYSTAMRSETLMMKSSTGGASGDVARLNGVRFVTCNELPDGKHFNEELLKTLTGQDTITARFLYKEEFTFKPILKMMICGNHQPVIKGTDNGIWRRVKLVPFLAEIPVADPNLTASLNDELSGILNWAIEGWRIYQLEGLSIPAVVERATNEYRDDMDIVGEWLKECTKSERGSSVSLQKLYDSFSEWTQRRGFGGYNSKWLSRNLKDRRAATSTRCSGGYYYQDLTLVDSEYEFAQQIREANNVDLFPEHRIH